MGNASNGTVNNEYGECGCGVMVANPGATMEMQYEYDDNLVAEADGSGTISKEYLYLGNNRLAMVDVPTGEIYTFLNDRLGTPIMMTDATNTVVWEATYSPFGEASVNPNSSVVNNFRFPGQYYDKETGFHYNWHRYYDPTTGRYLTPDPIGLAGGINLYGYVQNNPVNLTDPLGLWVPQAIGAAVGLGFEGYRQYQSGNLDVGRLAMAAATGALGGFGSSLATGMLFGASANMLNTAYQQADDPCQSINMGDVLRSGLYGAGGGSIGYAGGALGRNIFRPTNPIGQTLGQLPAHHYGASGSAIGAATGGFFANQ